MYVLYCISKGATSSVAIGWGSSVLSHLLRHSLLMTEKGGVLQIARQMWWPFLLLRVKDSFGSNLLVMFRLGGFCSNGTVVLVLLFDLVYMYLCIVCRLHINYKTYIYSTFIYKLFFKKPNNIYFAICHFVDYQLQFITNNYFYSSSS